MDDCDWVSSLYYLLQTDQKDKVVKYDIAPCIDGFAGNISLVYKSREEAVFGTYVARFGPFKKKKDCVKAAARCCVEDLKKDWKTLLLPFAAGATITYKSSELYCGYYSGEVILGEHSSSEQRFPAPGGPFSMKVDAEKASAKYAVEELKLRLAISGTMILHQGTFISSGSDDVLDSRVSQVSSVSDSEKGSNRINLLDTVDTVPATFSDAASDGNLLIDLIDIDTDCPEVSFLEHTGEVPSIDDESVLDISSSIQQYVVSQNITSPIIEESYSEISRKKPLYGSHVVDLSNESPSSDVSEGRRDIVLDHYRAERNVVFPTTATIPQPFNRPPEILHFDNSYNYVGMLLEMLQGGLYGLEKLQHAEDPTLPGFYSSCTVSFTDHAKADKRFMSERCLSKKASKKEAAFLALQYVLCQRDELGNVATVHCTKCDILLGPIVDFYFRCQNESVVHFAFKYRDGYGTLFKRIKKIYLKDGKPLVNVHCVNCLNISAMKNNNGSSSRSERSSVSSPSSSPSSSASSKSASALPTTPINNSESSIGVVDLITDKTGKIFVFGSEKITFKFANSSSPISAHSWAQAMTESIFSNVERVCFHLQYYNYSTSQLFSLIIMNKLPPKYNYMICIF